MTVAESDMAKAKAVVAKAEADLGPLSDGQRRDLLADNFEDWTMDYVWSVVDEMEPSE